jgi:aminoglycoside 3-N-acetyltransferase
VQEREAADAFTDILDRLGVRAGDRIMLGIDMGRLPLPTHPTAMTREAFRERKQQWCAFVLDALTARLGPKGTLLAPAFSYSCGAPGSVFDAETTPSENGPFTEYFRARAGVRRSLHPIFSIAGAGPDAEAMLGDAGRSAFGARSPFARFAANGVRFLCLGVELRNAITYVHHQEQSYGCPHRYNKSFDVTVKAKGRVIPGPWYACVAFRGITYRSDFASLQRGLAASGALAEATWNGQPNQLADIDDVDRVGYDLLSANPSAFVDPPLMLSFEESAPSDAAAVSASLSIRAARRPA